MNDVADLLSNEQILGVMIWELSTGTLDDALLKLAKERFDDEFICKLDHGLDMLAKLATRSNSNPKLRGNVIAMLKDELAQILKRLHESEPAQIPDILEVNT